MAHVHLEGHGWHTSFAYYLEWKEVILMPENSEKTVLTFRVTESGQSAYVLWPWTTPEAFLYQAYKLGAQYELRRPVERQSSRQQWLEFVAETGTHGEGRRNLFFGQLKWGSFVYRRFKTTESHYLTQHALDGLPDTLWHAAYEWKPGIPIGEARIRFRLEPTGHGVFEYSFCEWLQYFVSGRNEHFRNMAITVKKA